MSSKNVEHNSDQNTVRNYVTLLITSMDIKHTVVVIAEAGAEAVRAAVLIPQHLTVSSGCGHMHHEHAIDYVIEHLEHNCDQNMVRCCAILLLITSMDINC